MCICTTKIIARYFYKTGFSCEKYAFFICVLITVPIYGLIKKRSKTIILTNNILHILPNIIKLFLIMLILFIYRIIAFCKTYQ